MVVTIGFFSNSLFANRTRTLRMFRFIEGVQSRPNIELSITQFPRVSFSRASANAK